GDFFARRRFNRATSTTVRRWIPRPISSVSSRALTANSMCRPSTLVTSASATTMWPRGVAARCPTSTLVPTALSPGSRNGRMASSVAFSMARIIIGVANTLGSVGSLNRLARCSGCTLSVKLPRVPTGIGRMDRSRRGIHQWMMRGFRSSASESHDGQPGVLDFGRGRKAMADELAPCLEVLGAAEIDRVVLDRVPLDEQAIALRLLHGTLQLQAGAAAGAPENGYGLLHARLERGLHAGLDLDLRDFQHHDFAPLSIASQ